MSMKLREALERVGSDGVLMIALGKQRYRIVIRQRTIRGILDESSLPAHALDRHEAVQLLKELAQQANEVEAEPGHLVMGIKDATKSLYVSVSTLQQASL